MKSWYLIQTKPRQEITAWENLQRQGYQTYLPLARYKRRRRGKSYTITAPMFPLYLFISLTRGVDDWGPLRSTLGVSKLVTFGHTPASVPDELISLLQSREDDNGIQILDTESFNIGDRVRIAEGLFQGYEAVIHEKSASERVILLLSIIENQVRLELHSGQLEHLGD